MRGRVIKISKEELSHNRRPLDVHAIFLAADEFMDKEN